MYSMRWKIVTSERSFWIFWPPFPIIAPANCFVHVRKGRRKVFLYVTICVVRMCRNVSISHQLTILTLLGMSKRISSSSLLFWRLAGFPSCWMLLGSNNGCIRSVCCWLLAESSLGLFISLKSLFSRLLHSTSFNPSWFASWSCSNSSSWSRFMATHKDITESSALNYFHPQLILRKLSATELTKT